MLIIRRLNALLLLIMMIPTAWGQPQVELERTFTALSFDRPVDLQHHANNLFVAEQRGRIWMFNNDPEVQDRSMFLDIRDRVRSIGNEEGLLGLAFHPDFASNGYFFVNYTASSPRRTVVSRFKADLSGQVRVDPSSERIVLVVNQPASNHNGGQLAFGPDGYLYIALGDGGGAGDTYQHGQNTQSLLGTISRINVDQLPYMIPPDNPFVGSQNGRQEIFSWGLRNPWRFSIDSNTGVIYTADVGQNEFEEVNIIENGNNYGWPIMEGTRCFRPRSNCNQDGLSLPIFEYDHSSGPASVTGGYVYRGPSVPDLTGLYLLGDFVDGRFWGLRYDGTKLVESYLLINTTRSPLSFGIDHQGEVYMLANNGSIYRFTAVGGSLGFASFIEPLQFTRHAPIPETILPSARGGSGSFTYSITPSLPSGLTFNPINRTLSGTPDEGLNSTLFTLFAVDSNGLKGSTQFNLSIVDPTHTEATGEALAGFLLHGHYQSSEYTYVSFDLGESAIIGVDVFDLIGRQIAQQSPRLIASGSQQTIEIPTHSLPSGTYIYRIRIEADSGINTVSKLLLLR
ncbi:MAG: PQQ-dependent sugar dehydrogenase [Bacteroidetes bacterium]|nr:PQQ-dependent sugar dehydrogenase [Bacteroidota bacterium]